MGRASIKKGFWSEIFEWGANARSLIKNFPDIAEIAMGVIVNMLEALASKTDDESKSWYILTRSNLEGLKTWDSHGHQNIIKTIDEALAKFPAITEPNPP